MKRRMMEELCRWRTKAGRMPLVLNGARQVGKTYILEEFGRQYYANTVRFNLEADVRARMVFEEDLNPQNIILQLETISSQRILPQQTLLILDEIQASERALIALKSFCEQAPDYHVCAAGSMLGVAIHREKYSYPVGKVDELQLFPLDFEEFLWAMSKQTLAEQIRSHADVNAKMPPALHEDALALWRQYLVVGGMPAVVEEYAKTNSIVHIADIQQRILNEYVADMAKYASPATSVKIRACYNPPRPDYETQQPATSVKIRACYNSIPAQLAKENHKFQYKVVQRGGSATIFGESIEWLNYAGIVLKCQEVENAIIPIAAYVGLGDFKLYMSDVGLLTVKSGMPPSLLLSPTPIDNTFMGAIAENYVAQALMAKHVPLHYWRNSNTAELDFLWQKETEIIPIEVKKGLHTRAKSLNQFRQTYHPKMAVRISQKNFGLDEGIRSIPFYAVFCM